VLADDVHFDPAAQERLKIRAGSRRFDAGELAERPGAVAFSVRARREISSHQMPLQGQIQHLTFEHAVA
jgi:hypothetical protein